jgi:hypothetical protein
MTVRLKEHFLNGGKVEKGDESWRLSIPGGSAGQYRVAQLEDYTGLPRWKFPSRPPRTFSLRARVSADFAAGTWGFGFWNDPFGGSLKSLRPLPALPNAAWFFFASHHNYLSFREGKPGNGFLAQAFRSPRFDARLIPAALSFPFSRLATRRWLGRVIGEDGTTLGTDPTEWHAYTLRWGEKRLVFEVDDIIVMETQVSPHPPLGLVIWIDNQYAAFTPDGKTAWGILKTEKPAWLEIENVELSS